MKRIIASIALCAALAGCASGQPNGAAPVSRNDNVKGEMVVTYRGYDLHCVVLESAGVGDRSCDWQRFYADHPQLLKGNA